MHTLQELALFGADPGVTAAWPGYPFRSEAEAKAITDAYWGTGRDAIHAGGVIGAFEDAFAEYHQMPYALGCSSGTTALHLALIGAGVGPGDEVVTSPYTWGATTACILHANAIPVYADLDATFNLDAASIEAAISPFTKAIVLVHMYGMPCDMDPIMEVARKHNLPVIEDCAQCHGGEDKGRKVGTLGDFGCFSLQASKATPALEGGIVLTRDKNAYQRMLIYSMHPARQGDEIDDCDWARYIDSTAFNYRMHPFAAAMAKSQLVYLDERNSWRIKNCERLMNQLEGVPGLKAIRCPVGRKHVYHVLAFEYFTEELHGLSRGKFLEALNAEGAPFGIYINVPIPYRARFQDRFFYPKGNCPWGCALAGRQVEYKEGDLPRCEELAARDVIMYTGHLADERFELMDQLAAAVKKVVGCAEKLAELESQG